MEWIWYMIAALSAGVGTGLAGLSAATVMVPILIVLCPSFSGETGAYQATAIALMSDILGSAVTAYTYAREGRIDLKRSRIMLILILVMCTVGSWVAFQVGNVVLGSFTLFLTFCIGIRFLVKPDAGSTPRVAKGEKLDLKAVLWSVFWGLSIGFGTGFVGTGGGMMMLIVFTVILGMDTKTAVGTSTFIMTFTALIASVSHIMIHPAIVIEKWPVALLCMTVATASSLFSARFANRVKGRTVGLVTGVVLTVLGAAMLFLNYREVLFQNDLVRQVFDCFGTFFNYVVIVLIVLVLIRLLTKVPQFVYRKLLHILAFSFAALIVWTAESWQASVLTAVAAGVVVYPVLRLFERETWYAKMLAQKSPGEVRRSAIMIFAVIAFLVAVLWGVCGRRDLTAASILMWGTGDGAAALVGIPFGRHKVKWRLADGKKSWEGSGAMAAVSFLCGFLVLFLAAGMPLWPAVYCAGAGALAGTVTELASPGEHDTYTVPLAIALVLLGAAAL